MKKKTLFIILLILLTTFIVIISSKLVIVNSLCKKIDKFSNAKNFLYTERTYTNQTLLIKKVWLDKDNGRVLYKNIQYNPEDGKSITDYSLMSEYGFKDYSENSEGEVYLTNYESYATDEKVDFKDTETFNNNIVKELENYLKNIFKYSLSTETINGIKCYKIKGLFDSQITFIDKETGLIIRTIVKQDNFDEVIDYYYDFDCVTDKDFELFENLV